MNVFNGLVITVIGVIIGTVLGTVVIKKIAAQINDTDVTTISNQGVTLLGTNGLIGWVGVFIVVIIGAILLGYFMGGQKKGRA